MTAWGYARVSTTDQDPQLQLDALRRAGVDDEHLVIEHASAAKQNRPELGRLLELLQPSDVLTVWKLDRLGRSLSHLVTTITALGERGVQFRSLTESIDTTTAQGRLVFHLMAAVAEFERELVKERTANGIAAARAKNRPLGRPSKVSEQQYRLVKQMHEAGQPATIIAKTCGLSRSVVGRVVRGEIPSLAHLEQRLVDDHDLPLYPANGGRG
ncbi:recombinase family protein [Aestuariimicrobium ganziense]|uniref:recombinase family protein n=1 Tax=Aestuariimicrobium ganziense TaxID=2773677 RepID=UPI001940D2C9|nr:recombinase family protein [Aestuariimicrobium ganziense]